MPLSAHQPAAGGIAEPEPRGHKGNLGLLFAAHAREERTAIVDLHDPARPRPVSFCALDSMCNAVARGLVRVRGKQQAEVAGITSRFRFGNAAGGGRLSCAQGQITTLPKTSRFSISFNPCAAFCSGSTSSITGLILPSWIRSISALRFSS